MYYLYENENGIKEIYYPFDHPKVTPQNNLRTLTAKSLRLKDTTNISFCRSSDFVKWLSQDDEDPRGGIYDGLVAIAEWGLDDTVDNFCEYYSRLMASWGEIIEGIEEGD